MKITFASHAKDSSKSEGQEPWGEILVSEKSGSFITGFNRTRILSLSLLGNVMFWGLDQ